jgi:hypothetical protein
VFSSVTISHILKYENYELCFSAGSFVDQITTEKEGTVVWPSVRLFGGSMSLECFGGFLDQITTGKIKATVVWPSVAMFGGPVPCAWIVLMGSKLQPEKKVQLSSHQLECLLRTFDLLHPSR